MHVVQFDIQAAQVLLESQKVSIQAEQSVAFVQVLQLV
jgi:hypothetical protein